MMFLTAATVQAQITIGGNVYGGGNAGNTGGSTTVTVHAGDLNRVYGGARMADVKGRAFMNIDGAHASNYIVINRLYGGNDIAGTIGSSADELPDVVKDHAANNGVDKTWNALVLISSKITTPSTYYTAEDQEVIDGNKKVGDIKTLAIVAEDNKPYFCTSNQKPMYRELNANPNFEMTAATPEFQWIRIDGKVEFIDDLKIKQKVIDANDLVKALYESGDNPTFEVFTIKEGKATIADFSGEPPKVYEI